MKRIYLYSSILISILLFATCRDTKKQSTGKDTQIEWIQKTWDFGEISEGEEVCHTFRFKNIGNYPFIIKKVETGCGCTTVSYDKAPVPIIPYNDSADSLEQILTETHPLIANKTYVALDFETTGLNPSTCMVIEVGIARMVDGMVTEYFDTFVDPGMHIPEDASRTNNIFDKDVVGAPPIEYVLPQMLEFIGSSPVIAHNGRTYDYIILGRLLKESGLKMNNKLIDTLDIANILHKPGRHQLSDLCEYFHIPLVNAHRAYADCIATAKLFAELVRRGNLKSV